MSDLFNEEIISQATHTKWAGKTVHFARETDSTNLWGKRAWKEEGAGHGELFVQNISPQDADVLQDDGVRRRTVPLL